MFDGREIELDGLLASDHGMARRQVGVPTVVVEAFCPTALSGGTLRMAASNRAIELRNDTFRRPASCPTAHPAAELQHLCTDAPRGFDRERSRSVGPPAASDPLRPCRSRRCSSEPQRRAWPFRRATGGPTGRGPAGRTPPAGVHPRRETRFHPSFETGPNHALVDAAVSIEAASQGQALLADARVPAMGRMAVRSLASP